MADVANTTTAFCTNYEPCSDSPLSMSASVAGLITLTIAISATLEFYVSSYRDGIQGMDQLLRSLSISLDECTDALSASEAYLNSTFAEHEHDQARKRAQAIRTAAKKAADQVDSLHELTARLLSSPQQKWLGRYRRGVFVALQSEVNKRKSDNDAAMDVLRLTINKHEQYQDQLYRERQDGLFSRIDSSLESQSESIREIAQRLETIENNQQFFEAAASSTTETMMRENRASRAETTNSATQT